MSHSDRTEDGIDLPSLDCHAHVAADVTPAQIHTLGGAAVFAMTRSPAEAAWAARRTDRTLAWGFGVHPADRDEVAQLRPADVETAPSRHVVVGEVGLDRRGPLPPQQAALEAVLSAFHGRPALLSLHSTGRTRQVLDLLEQQPHPGAILHWWLGTPDQTARAVDLGCYFSVNNSMDDEQIALLPPERLLPETDYPASRRRTGASRPGDVRALESRLSVAADTDLGEVRHGLWKNLYRLALRAGVADRLPAVFGGTFIRL